MDRKRLLIPSFALATIALVATADAGAQVRRVQPAPQPVRQAPAPGVASFATPSAAGLTSSTAEAQLTPPMPAILAPVTTPNLSSPGVAPGSPAIDAGIAAPTTRGGVATVVVPQYVTSGTNAMGAGPATMRMQGPPSAVDIARAFMDADVNHDGVLSRNEVQRLEIPLPVSFDDLDRNRDGVLTRMEYEDAFR